MAFFITQMNTFRTIAFCAFTICLLALNLYQIPHAYAQGHSNTSAQAAASANKQASIIAPAPLVSIESHDAFFNAIAQHCGKAFVGEVVFDNDPSEAFSQRLVMHVRKCSDTQLQIPFHLGEDASRTWIITKTGSGLSLKHDHRKANGSNDPLTMYGGHTIDAGFNAVQSFPADQYSKELFVERGIPQSVGNTWQMFIYPEVFTYRLTREGRDFRVNFDLTQAVEPPPAPWGYAED